jgi:hypothetical protein
MTKKITTQQTIKQAAAIPKIQKPVENIYIIHFKARINNFNLDFQYPLRCDSDMHKRMQQFSGEVLRTINQYTNIEALIEILECNRINVRIEKKDILPKQNMFVNKIIFHLKEELEYQKQLLQSQDVSLSNFTFDITDPFKSEVAVKELGNKKNFNSIWDNKSSPLSLLRQSGVYPEDLPDKRISLKWGERIARTVGREYWL